MIYAIGFVIIVGVGSLIASKLIKPTQEEKQHKPFFGHIDP